MVEYLVLFWARHWHCTVVKNPSKNFFLYFTDSSEVSCPMVFDSFLCWPRTKAGEKVWQKCPEGVRGLDSQSKHLHFGILIYLCMHHSSFRIGLSPMFIGRHLVFLPRSQHQSRPRLDQLQPLLDGLDAENHGRFESNSQLSQCSLG